jgi:thiol-disulfide isomerase/thioredoxin
MPSIVESLYKDFVKPYYYRVFIAFLIVLFSLAAYYAYTAYYLPKANVDKLGKNVANANLRTKDAKLMFFYADWCPHCRNAKPIWQAEKEKYTDTLVNGYKVVFTDVDCSDNEDTRTQALVQEYNIQGFPTVKMVYVKVDGTPLTVDFDAKITKNSLEQFIQTVLNSS